MLTQTQQDLPRTTPEAQGIASSAVLRFVEAVESQIQDMHSFMLLRHGSVVAEGWWSPYDREYPHMMFSLSKSFTSTGIGLAVAEGRLSVDDPVLSFFPDERPAEVNEHLAAMRVRHLLSMSTGHADDTFPPMIEQSGGNWTKAFFDVPVLHEPGTYFLYNTGATYMLSAIVQKVTGMKLVDYLQPRLFEPLGIQNAVWDESPQGISVGGTGLHIKTEDIARLGQLYLQKGMWQGRQILPEVWVDEATAFHVSNGTDPASDWAQGYGYQFWRCRHGLYRGDGAFGQYCIVMPEQDAVLAITSGLDNMQQVLDLVWDILLPALNTESAADATTQNGLSEKLSSLSLPPLRGQALSPLAAHVSGQTFRAEANHLNIETITPRFTDSGCTITVKMPEGEEIITCGYGVWQQGETAVLNQRAMVGPTLTFASGAWTADDCFTMLVRLVKTPFVYTLNWHFIGDGLMVDLAVNVSFGPLRASLTAHRA